GAAVVLGGGLGVAYWFYSMITSTNQEIEGLNKEISEAKAKIKRVNDDKPLLDRWRRLSLPPDLNAGKGEDKQFLIDLTRKHNVHLEQFPPSPADTRSAVVHPGKPGKVPIYTGINFYVRARAKLGSLVSFLQDFQKAPRMHRIKTLTVERSDS